MGLRNEGFRSETFKNMVSRSAGRFLPETAKTWCRAARDLESEIKVFGPKLSKTYIRAARNSKIQVFGSKPSKAWFRAAWEFKIKAFAPKPSKPEFRAARESKIRDFGQRAFKNVVSRCTRVRNQSFWLEALNTLFSRKVFTRPPKGLVFSPRRFSTRLAAHFCVTPYSRPPVFWERKSACWG